MKIATILSRVRPSGGEDHCGCVRLCVGQRDADVRPPATCTVRRLLDGSNESRRAAHHASSNTRGRQ